VPLVVLADASFGMGHNPWKERIFKRRGFIRGALTVVGLRPKGPGLSLWEKNGITEGAVRALSRVTGI